MRIDFDELLAVGEARVHGDLGRADAKRIVAARGLDLPAFALDAVPAIRHGETLGSPIAIQVGNTEWPKWSVVMAPGECWYLDLDQEHSVVNRGHERRVHLVLDAVRDERCDQWLAGAEMVPREAGHGIGAVDGGGPIRDDFDALDQPEQRLDRHRLVDQLAAARHHQLADRIRDPGGHQHQPIDQRGPVLAQRLEEAQAIGAGHHHVAQDHVVGLGQHARHRRARVVLDRHVVVAAQLPVHRPGQRDLVVDDQHARAARRGEDRRRHAGIAAPDDDQVVATATARRGLRLVGVTYDESGRNSVAVLRDIPGLILAVPSNGADAARMVRECVRLAREEQRVVVFLEPIALYPMRDLHADKDGGWMCRYPDPSEIIPLGEVGVSGDGTDLAIVTFGNGVYLSQHALPGIKNAGINARIVDTRWLSPLPKAALTKAVEGCKRILISNEYYEALAKPTVQVVNEGIDAVTETGIDAMVSSWQRFAPNTIPAGAKAGGNYLSGQLIAREARRLGFGEGIALASTGLLSEGAGENLFLVMNGELHTTPVSAALLNGITRNTIISLAKAAGMSVIERDIPREYLYLCDELFMCGTAAEITPIKTVDGKSVGSGERGPITAQIQKLYFDLVGGRSPDPHGWREMV